MYIYTTVISAKGNQSGNIQLNISCWGNTNKNTNRFRNEITYKSTNTDTYTVMSAKSDQSELNVLKKLHLLVVSNTIRCHPIPGKWWWWASWWEFGDGDIDDERSGLWRRRDVIITNTNTNTIMVRIRILRAAGCYKYKYKYVYKRNEEHHDCEGSGML